MSKLIRAIDRLSVACAVAAAALIVLSILIVCWMVLVRWFGQSNYWELEMSIYLAVAATFLASPYTLKTKGHIGVDFMSVWLPEAWRPVLRRALAVVGFLVCLFLAWVGGEMAWYALATEERSTSLWRPLMWPLYASLPIGMALTALQYVAEILVPDREVHLKPEERL